MVMRETSELTKPYTYQSDNSPTDTGQLSHVTNITSLEKLTEENSEEQATPLVTD